jgi:YfiH family protein
MQEFVQLFAHGAFANAGNTQAGADDNFSHGFPFLFANVLVLGKISLTKNSCFTEGKYAMTINLAWQKTAGGFALSGAAGITVQASTDCAARPPHIITLRQVHGKVIHYAEEVAANMDGDGLITVIGLTIGVLTADCLPLVLFSPDPFCYAVIHAGWRGVKSGIVADSVALFAERGMPSSCLGAALAPGICGKCYEVGAEFGEWAAPFLQPHNNTAGKYYFDLPGMIVQQLRILGVPRIVPPPACTYEDENLPSHRRPTRKPEAQRILTWASVVH